MTERAVTVQPGRVTPLGDTLPAGTSIFNLDKANAIWVSNNPGVIPGQGAKVGAYGSIMWQGGACYAVPDTGVLAPVNLTLSDQAVSPVNPVDTATATAAQLALQGIPNVLIGQLAYSGSVPFPATSFTIPVDVSKYANLTIQLNSPSGTPQAWNVRHYDSATNTLLASKFYIQQANTSNGITFDVTPRGNQIRLYWPNSANVLVTVYGTNRTMPEQVIDTDPYYYGPLASQLFTQFNSVNFPGYYTTAGGLQNIYIDTNSTAPAGWLIARYLDTGGGARDLVIASMNISPQKANGPYGESYLQVTTVMPAGVYQLAWNPGTSGAANTYAITVTIIPQP